MIMEAGLVFMVSSLGMALNLVTVMYVVVMATVKSKWEADEVCVGGRGRREDL